jgi:hypothetical protein
MRASDHEGITRFCQIRPSLDAEKLTSISTTETAW